MKRFCKYFVLILFVKLISAKRWRCDYKFYEKCGGWLKFHEIPMSWDDARLTCYYEGAQLASPYPQLIDTIKEIIVKNYNTTRKVYTGINSRYSRYDFSSLEGVPLSRIPHQWAKGSPTIKLGVHKAATLNKNGFLSLVFILRALPFICYKNNNGLQLNKCGTIDNNYVMSNKTGSCYKFHRNPHIWSRGYAICEAEGGHLAIINSEVEAQHMKDILQSNPESSLLPTGFKDGAFIGVKDEGGADEHGLWVTVRGQTLSEIGYDKFGEGQPDNFGGDQHCLKINRNGVFDDESCKALYPFICEKDPNSLFCDD